MGSIISIVHNPKHWYVNPRETSPKETGEKLVYVTIGEFDDGLSGIRTEIL